jgi:hypothetical protein
MPGGELLDTFRSKRALAALSASTVAVSAFAIGICLATDRRNSGGRPLPRAAVRVCPEISKVF